MIGRNIKKEREKKNLTQKDLADMLGVSRQAVCMWEADKRVPDVVTLNKLARFFNVRVDKLFSPQDIISIRKEEGDMATKSRLQTVDFELMAPKASRVALSGSFNSWDKNGIAMKKARNGLWQTILKLKPGRYEYKFIVDGQWWTDPINTNLITNPFGSKNSVKEVAAR